jgi:hypothetical protein
LIASFFFKNTVYDTDTFFGLKAPPILPKCNKTNPTTNQPIIEQAELVPFPYACLKPKKQEQTDDTNVQPHQQQIQFTLQSL